MGEESGSWGAPPVLQHELQPAALPREDSVTAAFPGPVQAEDKETPRLFSGAPSEKQGASLTESVEQESYLG